LKDGYVIKERATERKTSHLIFVDLAN